MKILLVEDAVLILTYETQILRRAGHTVRATGNADTAARWYDQRSYDLVLTDLWHPGLEGHRLIKRILRKNPKQVVGVVSSSTVMEKKIDLPLLTKPFKPGELLSFVDSITGLPEQRQKALGHISKGTDWDVSALAKAR
jgi:DNA-binding response OmpR family regulator